MATLSDEQQRALWLMAGSPKGCTKAVLMAHGCPIEMLEKLVTAGLAETWTEEIVSPHPSRSLWQAGLRKRSIDWMVITEEGRKGLDADASTTLRSAARSILPVAAAGLCAPARRGLLCRTLPRTAGWLLLVN
jgi:hypothetical protein